MNSNREEAVWQRVLAASEEGSPRQSQTLTAAQVLELLEQTLLEQSTYRTLSARVGKGPRTLLRQLAREQAGQSRRLEAVYYLMTGTRPCPDRPKGPCVACTNEELRKAYDRAVEAAARCGGLAESAGSFAPVFRQLSRAASRRAGVLLRLLEQCL